MFKLLKYWQTVFQCVGKYHFTFSPEGYESYSVSLLILGVAVVFILAIVIGAGVVSVVLFFISLRTNISEHLFVYLLTQYIYYLIKCLSKHIFLIGYFVLFLFSFKSLSYIMNKNPLSYICFEIIFCKSTSCLFILLTIPFKNRTYFGKIQFIYYFFYSVVSKNLSITQIHKDFFSMFSTRSFILLCFTCWSMIHFMLILIWFEVWIKVNFLHVHL